MSKSEANSFLVKIRGGKFHSFRDTFVDSIKNVESVISVEPQKNQSCFYIDTTDSEWFISFLKDLKKELHRKNYGDLIYSKIHNVYSKKGLVHEGTEEEKKEAF
jgi:hypothetical protein